jgi:plastocyanin domain-containing protein
MTVLIVNVFGLCLIAAIIWWFRLSPGKLMIKTIATTKSQSEQTKAAKKLGSSHPETRP